MAQELTQERLKELLHYDPETGVFTRRKQAGPAKIGDIAGWTNEKGYRRVNVGGKEYFAHRLAWFYYYGNWPKTEIDHRDRDRVNNRIKNLREVTHTQNMQNRSMRSNGNVGVMGLPVAVGIRAALM